MPPEKVELDELLTEQEHRALTATIECSTRGDDYVRVTPFIVGSGCACDFGLEVKRDMLTSLARTGEVHLCCGKQLAVVAVELADETMRDVLMQLVSAAQTSRRDSRVRPVRDCEQELSECLSGAQDAFDTCMCYNAHRSCATPHLPRIPCPPPGP